MAVGTVIGGGRYAVRGTLASGGFKRVWRAHDTHLGIDVALAIFYDLGDARALRAAVDRETRVLLDLRAELPPTTAPLAHRVVEMTDFGVLTDPEPYQGPFIATRLVEGSTLRGLMAQAPLPWRRVVRIGIGMLEALEVSHTRTPRRGPVLHRDVKPANVVVGPGDEVTMLDFGVAKVSDTTRAELSQVVGTLQYMAPEQFEEGGLIGPAVDLFSVGVIMHELLTGQAPWPRGDLRSALTFYAAVRSGQRPALEHLDRLLLPADLKLTLQAALSIDPEARPASARQMRAPLERLLAPAKPPTPRPRMRTARPDSPVPIGPDTEVTMVPEASALAPKPPSLALPVLFTLGVALALFAVGFVTADDTPIIVPTPRPAPSRGAPSEAPVGNKAATPAPQPDDAAPAMPPRRVEAARPVEAKTLSQRAEALLVRGQHDAAFAILTGCLQHFPESPECKESLRYLHLAGYRKKPAAPALPPAPEPAPEPEDVPEPEDDALQEPVRVVRSTPSRPDPSWQLDIGTEEDADYLRIPERLRRQLDDCLLEHRAEATDRPESLDVFLILQASGRASRTRVGPEAWQVTRTAHCIEARVLRWKFPDFVGSPRNASFTITLLR